MQTPTKVAPVGRAAWKCIDKMNRVLHTERHYRYGQCLVRKIDWHKHHILTLQDRLLSRDQDSGIDPEVFAPERFLESHVKKVALDPYSYSFGFGRRWVYNTRYIQSLLIATYTMQDVPRALFGG